MATIFGLLGGLAGLASFILFIMVLIKLFQRKGVLHGILGLICSIYTFIWGWMSVDENENRNVMLGWTGAIIAGFAFNLLAGMMSR
jgi:multisubunit Na+/H+ antiporter MnhB subunit